MQVNGRMFHCDRCNATDFFKHTNDRETDGGFTRWNEFEKAEGWGRKDIQGKRLDLCPKCFKEYCERFEQFETSFMDIQK